MRIIQLSAACTIFYRYDKDSEIGNAVYNILYGPSTPRWRPGDTSKEQDDAGALVSLGWNWNESDGCWTAFV